MQDNEEGTRDKAQRTRRKEEEPGNRPQGAREIKKC